MDERFFELIEPMEEKPITKRTEASSRFEQVILEFARANYKYASVKDELVKERKSVNGYVRAMGRALSTLKKNGEVSEDVRVYSSMGKVYLEKEKI